MTRLTSAIAFACLLVLPASVSAQYTRDFNPWPVIVDNDTLQAAFWGGINNPKPSLKDFNNDGLLDLFLGDTEGRLGYFRNEGTAAAPSWVPVTEQLGDLDIATWHLLADIDADGDLDLFCDSRSATVEFWRNDGGTDSLPIFTLEDTAYQDFETGVNNTPAFADIDNDNDFDFFFGATTGALELYSNVGDSANAVFTLTSDFYDSVLAFPGAGGSQAAASADPQHGFSAIYLEDLDDDQDLDLFWGDIFNTNMYYFENLGTPANSDLNWVTEFFLLEPTSGFNHPRLGDIDADGDPDMILGVANAAALDNLHLLRNIGTPDQPFFTTETRNLIGMIDVGGFSQPAFGDLDGDGDDDLLIGGGLGQIQYFENIGGKSNPVFELATDSLAGIDVGLNAAPAVIDWDSDGDLDLLIGTQQGRIEYWRNDGSPTNFAPVLADPELGGIKVDQYAVPRPADLSDDNLTDLIVGEWDFNSFANVLLYENTGTPGAPDLTLVTPSLLKRELREYTVPEPYDWNNDGRIDLIVGGRASGLTVYLNGSAPGAFPDSTLMTATNDTMPGYNIGTFTAPRFVDFDSDGDADILLGEENGGLTYFEKEGNCCNGTRGNVNSDIDEEINVSDLTVLIDFLFRGADDPDCLLEANVDGGSDEAINVSDLTFLIDFLFRGGSAPPDCL